MTIKFDGLPYSIINFIELCSDSELDLVKEKVFKEATERGFEK